MENDRDARIRQRAHEIWEQEGRPDGKESEHWEQAERELSADLPPLADAAVKKKAPSTRTGASKSASEKPAVGGAKKTSARKA